MYTKDLASLLSLLNLSEQDGLLQIEPPASEEVGALWQAHIQLDKGNVRSCVVQRKIDGQIVLRDAEALNWLAGLGGLTWRLLEAHVPPQAFSPALPLPAASPNEAARPAERSTSPLRRLDPVQPNAFAAVIPRRTIRGMETGVNRSWPRDYRIVFALVDGRRTCEEIATVLRIALPRLAQIINDFRAAGLLE